MWSGLDLLLTDIHIPTILDNRTIVLRSKRVVSLFYDSDEQDGQDHNEGGAASDEQSLAVGADAVEKAEDQEVAPAEGHDGSTGEEDTQGSEEGSGKRGGKRRRSRRGIGAYGPALGVVETVASNFIAQQNSELVNNPALMGVRKNIIKQFEAEPRAQDWHKIFHPEIHGVMPTSQRFLDIAQVTMSKTWDDIGFKLAQSALAGEWEGSSALAGVQAAGVGAMVPAVEPEVLNIVSSTSVGALKDYGLGGVRAEVFEKFLQIPGVAAMYANATAGYLQTLGGKPTVDTAAWNALKGIHVDSVASQVVTDMAVKLAAEVEKATFSNLWPVISGAMQTVSIDAWESVAGTSGMGDVESILEGMDEFENLEEFSEIRDWFDDDGDGFSVDLDEEDIAQQVEEALREKFSTAEFQSEDALYWQRFYQESVARETQLVATNKGLIDLGNHLTARIESLEKRLEALEQQNNPNRLKQTLKSLLTAYRIAREVVLVIALPVLMFWFTVVEPIENYTPQTAIEEDDHMSLVEPMEEVSVGGAQDEPAGASSNKEDPGDDEGETTPREAELEDGVERSEGALGDLGEHH